MYKSLFVSILLHCMFIGVCYAQYVIHTSHKVIVQTVCSKPVIVNNIPVVHINATDVKVRNELTCIALNIYFEARNQQQAGQIAVSDVVFNRKQSNAFPNTFCGVIYQKGQFSWTHDGKSDIPKDKNTWNTVYALAKQLKDKYTKYPNATYSNGALFYHADYVDPYWDTAYVRVAHIDTHIFYR